MKAKNGRHTPAERAMHRRYMRIYGEIFSRACNEILTATGAEYQTMALAFKGLAVAVRQGFKQVVSDIVAEYLKEKIIRPLLGEVPMTEELHGCTVTFRPEGSI